MPRCGSIRAIDQYMRLVYIYIYFFISLKKPKSLLAAIK